MLLLIAQQKPKKAVKAIRAILNHHSDYEKWLHRDLFFAGSCLAENPKDLKVADNSLSTKILEQLVDLKVSDSPQVTYKVRDRVFQTLGSLNETGFKALALQMLKDKANFINEVRLQKYYAALGEDSNVRDTAEWVANDEDFLFRELRLQEYYAALGEDSNVRDTAEWVANDEDFLFRHGIPKESVNLGNVSSG